MKKKAAEIKKGDIIQLGGEEFIVEETEESEVAKQGAKKVRIVAKKKDGAKITIIRPSDYPVDIK